MEKVGGKRKRECAVFSSRFVTRCDVKVVLGSTYFIIPGVVEACTRMYSMFVFVFRELS